MRNVYSFMSISRFLTFRTVKHSLTVALLLALTGCASVTHRWPDGSETQIRTFAKQISGEMEAVDEHGHPVRLKYGSRTDQGNPININVPGVGAMQGGAE